MAEDSSSGAAGGSAGEEIEDTKPCARGHWRPSEDEQLRQLVEKFGPQNWNSIAEKLQGRTGKSCRLRWFNQLDPKINRMPFTQEEEEMLVAAHRIHGNKWAQIARLFPGRTDNAVKNQWHVLTARRQRGQSKQLRGKRSFEDLYYDFSPSNDNNDSFPYQRATKLPHEQQPPFGSSRIDLKNFGSMASFTNGSPYDWSDYNNFNNNTSSNNVAYPNSSSPFGGGFCGNSNLSTLPNYSRVVDAAADDDGRVKSDNLMSFCDNSSTLTKLRASSSTEQEQEQAEASSSNDNNVERNEVPFIDFLGVGSVSSP